MPLSAADQIKFNTKRQAAATLRAAARTLTRAAAMAQDALITEEKKDFRAPVAFTTNTHGYRLVPAKPKNLISKMTVREPQARYLRFTFEQLVRNPGDPGTSRSNIWVATTEGERPNRRRCHVVTPSHSSHLRVDGWTGL
jgi:hypothetical protein